MCVLCIAKLSWYQCSNQKVVGSIPSVGVVVSLSKKLYLHCYSLPNCINGDLVLIREAAHPAVTLIGTVPGNNWGNKCQTAVHVH